MYRWVTFKSRSLWQFLTLKKCTGKRHRSPILTALAQSSSLGDGPHRILPSAAVDTNTDDRKSGNRQLAGIDAACLAYLISKHCGFSAVTRGPTQIRNRLNGFPPSLIADHRAKATVLMRRQGNL